MTPKQHFIHHVSNLTPKNPATIRNPLIGSICKWNDIFYVYLGKDYGWFTLEDANAITFEV